LEALLGSSQQRLLAGLGGLIFALATPRAGSATIVSFLF
jgi:hypothetical protein